jgi:hypothetical protein
MLFVNGGREPWRVRAEYHLEEVDAMRSATLRRLTAIAIFAQAGSAYAQQPMATRTEAFRGITSLINHPRSVWWDALGLPSFGRGTDKGWVNDRQIDLTKPIYEVWERAGGLGMTVFWNPSAMAEKAPTGYDIKKQIEGGKTTVRDYFDSRDPFNSHYNPLPEKITFWTEQEPMTLSEAVCQG